MIPICGCCDNECAANVERWTNTTQVPNYALDGDGNPVGDASIDPYPRPADACTITGGIVGASTLDPPECQATEPLPHPNALPKCANLSLDLEACATPDSTHASHPSTPTRIQNCFEKTGGAVSYHLCGRLGFKNVQAISVWHGRKPFNSIADLDIRDRLSGLRAPWDYNCADPDDPQDEDCVPVVDGSVAFENCGCTFETPHLTPETTKYLTADFEVSSELLIGQGTGATMDWDYPHNLPAKLDPGEQTVLGVRHVEVSSTSGVATQDACDEGESESVQTLLDTLDANNVTVDTLIGLFTGLVAQYANEAGGYMWLHFTSSADYTRVEVSVQDKSEAGTVFIRRFGIDTQAAEFWDYDAGFMEEINVYDYTAESGWTLTETRPVFCPTHTERWVLGATTLDYFEENLSEWLSDYNWEPTFSGDRNMPASWWDSGLGAAIHRETWPIYSGGGGAEDNRTHILVTLSDANPVADVYTDLKSLLAQVSLADRRHPWRNDGAVTIAPVVRRDSYPTPQDPTALHACGYEDESDYTGAIIGALMPEGYDRFWNPYQSQTDTCVSGSSTMAYEEFRGAWSTGAPFPACTSWTHAHNAMAGTPHPFAQPMPLGPGAWIHWQGNGVVCAQKWAEAKLPWAGHNYFRPCGEDRYLVDETTSRCIDEATLVEGTPDTIVLDLGTQTHSFVIGEQVIYWDGSTFSEATVYDTDTNEVTLNADSMVAAAGMTHWVNSDAANNGTPALAKLIVWEYSDTPRAAWPICGVVDITAATNEEPVTITVDPASQWLRDGDQVEIGGCTGNTAPNSTVVDRYVKRLSETNFELYSDASLSTPVAGNGDYTGGGTMHSYGVPGGDLAYATGPEYRTDNYVLFQWGYNFRDIAQCDQVCANEYEYCSHDPDQGSGANSCPVPDMPEVGGSTPGCITVGSTRQSDLRWNQALNGVPREVSSMALSDHTLGQVAAGDRAAVILISPEAAEETAFTTDGSNCVRHDFPATCPADDRYLARWWAHPVQAVQEPLYRNPPTPFEEGESGCQSLSCAFNVAPEGSCPTNDPDCEVPGAAWYYPFPRLVEARTAVVGGAPDLPDGYYVGWIPLSGDPGNDLQTYPAPAGNIAYPPDDVGGEADDWENVGVAGPWVWWFDKQSCACANARFAEYYLRDGIDCENIYNTTQ